MNRDWSKEMLRFIPGGRVFWIFDSSFFTRSTTSTVLVPDCF